MYFHYIEEYNTKFHSVESIPKAIKSNKTEISVSFKATKLICLPKNYLQLQGFNKIQLDISHNRKTIDLEKILIQISSLTNVTSIGLMSDGILNLSKSIADIENLELLDLSYNKGIKLPEEFSKLKKLKYLNLSNCGLSEIPKPIFELETLEVLKIGNNKITEISDEILKLKNLKRLDIAGNGLSSIPLNWENLDSLMDLDISKNLFTNLPSCIPKFKNLKICNFHDNPLKNYEALNILKESESLRNLVFYGENCTEIPQCIDEFKNLENLYIKDTNISNFPILRNKLKNLKHLKIEQNVEINSDSIFKFLSNLPEIKKIVGYQLQIKNSIPDSIKFCTQIEEINIYSNELEYISPHIQHLKNLKVFDLNGSENSKLKAIPDVFMNLNVLETFSVSNFKNTCSIPTSIFKNQSLKNLTWIENGVKLSASQVNELKKIESLNIEIEEQFDFEAFKSLINLRGLTLHKNNIQKLPDYFRNISSFSFRNLPNLEVNDAISKLPKLEHLNLYDAKFEVFPKSILELTNLKSFYLYPGQRPISFEQLFKIVEKNPQLDLIYVSVNDTIIPPEITTLNSIKNCTINFNETVGKIKTCLEIVNLDLSRVKLNSGNGIYDLVNSLKKINTLNLKTNIEKEIAFGLISTSFSEMYKYFDNPFNGDLNGLTFCIFGSPTICKLSELKTQLKNLGAALVSNLSETVDYIIITGNLKEDYIKEIAESGKKLVLEDRYQELLFQNETPFILEDNSNELTDQITRLLKNKTEDNTKLVLEIIDGGGANKVLISYLIAIHLFHNDNDIRKKAREVYKKYASAELQTYIKTHWKDSFRNKSYNFRGLINKLFNHKEISLFSVIFAFKMTRFHEVNNQNDFKNLILTDYDGEYFDESILPLDFVENLQISGSGTFDLEKSFSFIETWNLKSIHIENKLIIKIPQTIVNFKNLERLHISHNSDIVQSLILPTLSKLKNLTEFSLNGYQIENIENIADLKDSLQKLDISNAKLEYCPKFLEEFVYLHHLNLSGNLIKSIEINFSHLKELQYLFFYNNPISLLSDSFEYCSNLESINFDNCKLETFPVSVINIQSDQKNYRTLNISMYNNNINSIPSKSLFNKLFSKKNTWKIGRFNLASNKFPSIPNELLNIEIGELILDKNPIEEINPKIIDSKISQISLDDVKVKTISKEIIESAINLSLSNNNQRISLPDPNSIQNFKGYKRIYFKDMTKEDIETINEINKKQLGQQY